MPARKGTNRLSKEISVVNWVSDVLTINVFGHFDVKPELELFCMAKTLLSSEALIKCLKTS